MPKAVKGRPSTIAGWGLIAVAPIAKDEIVAIKGGHIVDTAGLEALPERLRNSEIQIADPATSFGGGAAGGGGGLVPAGGMRELTHLIEEPQ